MTWDTQRDLTNNGPTKPAPLLISTATNAGEMEVEATVEAFHAKETDVETMEAGTMVIMEDGIMATMEGSTMEIMGDLLGMKAILHQLDKSVQIADDKKFLFIHET